MEQLVLELASEDHNVQTEAFSALLVVLKELGKKQVLSPTDSTEYAFPNDLWQSVIDAALNISNPKSAFCFDTLLVKAMNRYLDIKFYTLRNFEKVLSKGVSESQAIRIFDVLVLLDLPSEKYLIDGDALVPAPSGRDVLYRKFTHFKGEFTSSWFALLPYMPALRLKKFLANLDKKIIPSIYQPVLLADFLSRSYSAGGFIGVLALDGLFTLMTTYNLDFPSFYEKLYALLDSKILHAPYRRKFFRLFRLFMSSTMIPAYVVAAMIKRIARLSLAAPPSALVWTIPFIYNMLHEHPVCRAMIHREVSDDWTDPFNPKETNLEKCFAFESSLWELLALENHYWPRIAKLSCIFREKFTKPKFNLDLIADEIDQAESRLAANEELSHRWSKRPPTKIAIPDCAFDV